MFTSLPLVMIDGAEKVVPVPATACLCQVEEPLTARKTSRLWVALSTAMLTSLPLVVIDGAVLAMAGAAPASPSTTTAAAASSEPDTGRRLAAGDPVPRHSTAGAPPAARETFVLRMASFLSTRGPGPRQGYALSERD